MDSTIRPMHEGDWNSVAAIYQQGIDTGKATFQSSVPTYEEWDSAHTKDCRLVAVENGEVAGWVALTPVSGRCIYRGVVEVSIYIGEAYRKKGIGKKLMTAIIDESEACGYWTLYSSIFEENLASLELHKQCGFRLIGYRERIGRDNTGRWRNTVLMERRSQTIGVD